ncbi:GNAT family N-acetyltransferase [Streptomyces boncukensis]|uniref:GNAT family N-acetyltransferase n=1 Tax=Streptomyces boncukensis TaxID=2711219 RepID=A0A6G4WQU6_9ACTN|nr:GNAT family N-acetyltransferase [Streptomyces boncukensis]NGO67636.1 GNAT family N-acetyltransferase [Streptomyces boncukensis]
MRFRWDWLHTVITAPYVPTIGPVHPAALSVDLFADIVEVAGTGRFLPYDKDRRWSAYKSDSVLVEEIAHGSGETLVPSLSRRGKGSVAVYVYGARPESRALAADLAAKLATAHGAAQGRVVWFLTSDERPPLDVHVTRVQLREFTVEQPAPAADSVRPLDETTAPVRSTFPHFAERLADSGFAFLHARMDTEAVGPVLTAVDGERVAGAIGPMEVMRDPRGSARLLPQYFGVLPECRGKGYGRALWRAAMHWGQSNGAAYQLLQTELGGASDHLCRAESLSSLGYVCTARI